jgi:hypothetical protein
MTLTDALTLLAIVLGPIAAIQVQKFLERAKERRQKQLWLFGQLLSTRGAKLSADHVNALNLIDLIFSKEALLGGVRRSKSDDEVVTAWKRYRGQLHTEHDEQSFPVWIARVEELFVELLFAMSNALGYSFDKEDLQRGAYTPQGHGQRDFEDHLIRQALVAVAKGDVAIPVRIVSDSEDAQEAQSRSKR